MNNAQSHNITENPLGATIEIFNLLFGFVHFIHYPISIHYFSLKLLQNSIYSMAINYYGWMEMWNELAEAKAIHVAVLLFWHLTKTN